MELNDKFLEHFMATFYGSGNYSGDYWFIGMEEGGGKTFERVQKRLDTWQELGEPELVDIYDFHLGINYPDYFTNPVKLQQTWKQYTRILLASKGEQTNVDNIRAYQRDYLGRKVGETCLLELLPLPSPGLHVWNYSNWSNLPYLSNRDDYETYCLSWRCKHIQYRIRTYKPKLVVFSGKRYNEHWQQIAGNDLKFVDEGGFLMASSLDSVFVIANHPAAWRVTNAYFEEIGLFVQDLWKRNEK